MKNVLIAALLACSLCVVADEAVQKPAEGAGRRPPSAEGRRLTPEQRKEFHERMMAARKARQAEIQVKVVAALKEAGLTDEQAKQTADKIEKIYMEGRRPPMGLRRHGAGHPPRPAAPAAK